MISRLNHFVFCFRLITYALPLTAFIISWYIRFFMFSTSWGSTEYDPYAYFGLLVFTTMVWAIAADHYKVTSVEELYLVRTGIRAVVAATSATYFVTFAALFFLRAVEFSRVFLFVSAVTLILLSFFFRAAFRNLVRRQMGARRPIRVLMVGADRFARRAAYRLHRGPFACRVVGFVHLPGQEVAVQNMPNAPLYDGASVGAISHGIDDVIIALNPSDYSRIPEAMKLVERFCLPVRAIVDLGNGTIVRDRLFQFGRIQMLDLAHSPAESLHYSVLKRIFDMLFSVFVILISAPVMLAIAVAIRLSSSGPVFFSQERVGLNGKAFRMYKFRTMVVVPLAESDTAWTTADDGRRTRLGAFLRRTSLDELPQFLNVLKGDMSVVGPRPERPHFVRKFRSDFSQYHIRHRLKAGITGWAQVNGLRGDTSIQKRVEYDLYYLQNWSLGFDLRIIFMTIAGGLVSKNAY